MHKIFVEICSLPYVERYEDAQEIYDSMLQKKTRFQGNDKALAFIASRKWVHTYRQAVELYNGTTMCFFSGDQPEDIFEDTKRKLRFDKNHHHKVKKKFRKCFR